jgi:ribosomal protein RSM22 (predicted rRNA methylase)
MTLLPGPLRSALDALAEGCGRADLARRSRAITETYQARRNSSHSLLSNDDALAYALARMPATYAAALEAFGRLAEAMPDFAPRDLLDVGCGPGTASFAAVDAFPTLEDLTLLDRNGPFLDMARTLGGQAVTGKTVALMDRDVASDEVLPEADLVVASYVLAELDERTGERLVSRLWGAARQALVLVEPGTPDGFARLRSARSQLMADSAHVAAPCTHEAACPMSGDAWCRFLARVQRSRDHKLLKGGARPFEDEPYAYLALTRERPAGRTEFRIVGRTSETKVVVALPVCGEAGLKTLSAPSRARELFKRFRKLDWGDAI